MVAMSLGIGRKSQGDWTEARLTASRLALALLLTVGAAASAEAQFGGNNRVMRPDTTRPQQPQPESRPAPIPTPTPKAAPEPWPRLEVGALFCKSRDDLVKYQTKLADGASAAVAGQALDCRVLRKQTGIKILDHDGPSRTQIVTTDAANETGWTNAYVPTTTPPVAKGEDEDNQRNGNSLYRSNPNAR
jgi:hypothetical protein